jgi:hypothetical protein
MNKLFTVLAISAVTTLSFACSSEDDEQPATGGTANAGSGGKAGSGGTAGKGGASGMAGSGGTSGSAGSAGTGGATSGMPLGKDNPPTLGAQIDRNGRPAISTALIDTFNADETMKGATKDAYNAASDPTTWATQFVPKIMTSLAILDGLDGTCGNQLLAGPTGYQAFATVLADDRLYVNTASGTCDTYLGVEAQALGAVTDGGCGGRTPLYDVIERSYSVLATGQLAGVDDAVTMDDAAHSATTFPFLAE